MLPGCHEPEPKEKSWLVGSTILDLSDAYKWTRAELWKCLQSNDLPTELFKWRKMAADQNQWRATCSSKMPSATEETPTSSRQDIWAELRYGTIPSWLQKLTRKHSTSKQNERKEREKKYTHSQTSRLENPEELQVHHHHEKFLFLSVLLLFAQCKMNYWWLVTWLELNRLKMPIEELKRGPADNKKTSPQVARVLRNTWPSFGR
jgi:hypothetical protein